LTIAERAKASAAAPRKTIEKLFVLHFALADERTSKTDVAVLAVLIEATHKQHGYCWGAVGTIAAAAGISERTVQRTLARLEVLSYIRIDAVGGAGPKSTNRYYVEPLRVSGVSPLALPRHTIPRALRVTTRAAKGDTNGSKGDKPSAKGDRAVSPDSSYIDTTDLDPTDLNPSAPAAPQQAAARRAPDKKKQSSKTKNAKPDPLTSLPHNPDAFLARVERAMAKTMRLDEARVWYAELDALVENPHMGDTAGRAQRLAEALGARIEQHERNRATKRCA
jgi:hypothetical protein